MTSSSRWCAAASSAMSPSSSRKGLRQPRADPPHKKKRDPPPQTPRNDGPASEPARRLLPSLLRNEGQVLRHNPTRGRRGGGSPRRLGDRAQPLEREPASRRSHGRGRDQRRGAPPAERRRGV